MKFDLLKIFENPCQNIYISKEFPEYIGNISSYLPELNSCLELVSGAHFSMKNFIT